MKLLIDRGADVNFKSNDGLTPLHEAAKKGNSKKMVVEINVKGLNSIDSLLR